MPDDPWRCQHPDCGRHHPVPSLARACEATHEQQEEAERDE